MPVRTGQLLAGTRAGFTAVGDDDQAIYGWRGATIENLAAAADFPQLQGDQARAELPLDGPHPRAANALIAHNPKLFDKTLWSEQARRNDHASRPQRR